MRIWYPLLIVALLLSGCDWILHQVEYPRAMEQLAAAKGEQLRFYALGRAAKESFEVGRREDARKYALELLEIAPRHPSDWNYGNAIHDGNIVLGRLAVVDGRLEEAKTHLQAAGDGPGSPQLDSFGPSMSIASDLLARGERVAVVDYLRRCGKFWTSDDGKLKLWREQIEAGQTPAFGANLVY